MTAESGLDLTVLRAVHGRRRDRTALINRVAAHLNVEDGFVAWSGGKDSTVVVDLARRADPDVPVVFYDSGLEYPETLDYISELTRRWDLNLSIIKTQPDLLTALVAVGDFTTTTPTRQWRRSLRQTLIGDPAARAHDLFGPGSLWGVRAGESSGRRHLYATHLSREVRDRCHTCCADTTTARVAHGGMVRRADGTTTFGPIWNWTATDVLGYLAAHDIPLNPVYNILAAAGLPAEHARVDAIIDPAHLHSGQITRLQYGWPTLYDRLVTALPRLAEHT